MRRHSTPHRLRIIPAMIVCLFCAGLAQAQGVSERSAESPGEAVAERPEIRRFEPLPTVEQSDIFTTSPIERSRDLSTIRLSAAPPQGSPEVASPLHAATVDGSVRAGHHDPNLVSWVAPALAHQPVYFEEVGVERYGQTRSPALQPLISGGKFLANSAILPYKMGVDSPHRLSYDVGLPRPGSPTAGVRETLPLSLKGLLYQGAATTGAVFFIRP